MRAFLRGFRRVKHESACRSLPRLHCALASAIAALLAACGGSPSAPEPDLSAPPGEFSGALAWTELTELAKGPRALGSEGAEAARQHIRARMAALGIAVESLTTTSESKDFGPLSFTHLVATLPGVSRDRIVLIAPYDSGRYDGFAFVGANDGASGAALLLELARVLAGRERPYTVQLVWLEGEGRLGHGSADERELRWLGSRSLADHWAQTGQLDGIRLLVSFNRVCDADLRIARDSGSHREHRESFWKAARRLGLGEVFSSSRGYESVESSHVAFRDHGVRPVVAIEDTAFGGKEAPGIYAGRDDVLAHCAPESLEAVGRVASEAVESIATRLAKIDRFSRMPSAETPARSQAPVQPTVGDDAVNPAPSAEPAESSSPNGANAEVPDAADRR
jgi:hypothetical protein